MENCPSDVAEVVREYYRGSENLIKKAIEWGFLLESPPCRFCHQQLYLVFGNLFDDDAYFRCRNFKCRRKLSLKFNTIFKNSKLSFSDILLIFAYWCADISPIAPHMVIDVSKKSVSYHYYLLRILI